MVNCSDSLKLSSESLQQIKQFLIVKKPSLSNETKSYSPIFHFDTCKIEHQGLNSFNIAFSTKNYPVLPNLPTLLLVPVLVHLKLFYSTRDLFVS